MTCPQFNWLQQTVEVGNSRAAVNKKTVSVIKLSLLFISNSATFITSSAVPGRLSGHFSNIFLEKSPCGPLSSSIARGVVPLEYRLAVLCLFSCMRTFLFLPFCSYYKIIQVWDQFELYGYRISFSNAKWPLPYYGAAIWINGLLCELVFQNIREFFDIVTGINLFPEQTIVPCNLFLPPVKRDTQDGSSRLQR